MKELVDIFIVFFKMSAVTFGGGYAMLPILQREIVDKRQWITHDRIIDYYAVSQGLPGIIAVNVSIFIGKEKRGVLGGIAGALGIVGPCLVIITIIAMFLSGFQTHPIVRNAFAGVAVCVAALIFDAVLNLWKKAVKDLFGIALFGGVFLGMLMTRLSPVVWILGAAIIGIIYSRSLRRFK